LNSLTRPKVWSMRSYSVAAAKLYLTLVREGWQGFWGWEIPELMFAAGL
jgi:hypothetical protein